jgi:hypothetical protein
VITIVVEAIESIRVLGGFTYLEEGVIYLLPVRYVKLGPGLHMLRPVGARHGTIDLDVKLLHAGDLPNGEVR